MRNNILVIWLVFGNWGFLEFLGLGLVDVFWDFGCGCNQVV
jgi:hypothetical protein